jgi:myo-inositol catabolism protein IolC
MDLGYDRKLYILAFDHRGSFIKRFGIERDLTPEDTLRIADGKGLIFEGIEVALERGADSSVTGALVDEQFGGPAQVPERAKAMGIKLAMPVEKSGQKEFDFEYGEDFGAHIERYDPAEEAQLASVDGDSDRYDAELRPELMRRTIAELQEAAVEPDVWKIEGVDQRADCERIAAQCRAGDQGGVACVVLGRGADEDKVDYWLRQGAPVAGYVGFAIGRSIWGDPLNGFIDGSLSRDDAAARIADNYLRFIEIYASAEAAVA